MSMSRTVYLGVFIQCKKSTLVEENASIVCPNGHKVGNGRRFCPECGHKTVEKKTSEIGFMNLYNMFDKGFVSYDFEEVMMSWSEYKPEDTEILVPNDCSGIDLSEYESDIDLSKVDISKEIKDFEVKYKDFIEATKPYYDEYKIVYGITNWYS